MRKELHVSRVQIPALSERERSSVVRAMFPLGNPVSGFPLSPDRGVSGFAGKGRVENKTGECRRNYIGPDGPGCNPRAARRKPGRSLRVRASGLFLHGAWFAMLSCRRLYFNWNEKMNSKISLE
jgi:hypothetical protein